MFGLELTLDTSLPEVPKVLETIHKLYSVLNENESTNLVGAKASDDATVAQPTNIEIE